MNTTNSITFCVNVPLSMELSFKEFRKMDAIAILDDKTAQAVWKSLAEKAGKEATIMTDADCGYDVEDGMADASCEVETMMNDRIEEAIEEVKRDEEEEELCEECEKVIDGEVYAKQGLVAHTIYVCKDCK